ncbi:MAG TPA: TonB-dependent receptor [Candidatus Limnocylindrales bacterium]|nr:TonB-dependent receptor [Candidatus Limnocylindrales bacterium]
MKLKAVAALLLCVSALAFGQAAGVAGISGVVHDASGAVVPGAKVTISSTAQGTLRTLTTNSDGVFTAPGLPPGSGYSVNVSATGFSPYDVKNVQLQVGQNLDLKVTLAVGQATTQVEVTGTAPLIEDTKTDVSGVVGDLEIRDLPINGRRVDSFVLLEPGVTNDGTFGLLSFRGVAGQNSFLVDGNDTTEQFYNENAGRTRIAAQISQDAVQEFQVVSSNYSAEYGRAMGGIVNTVTKSGGNNFHGTAFWFYRSTGFNARDPFSTFVPSEKRNQIGGTFGGPIVKDKLFFFLSTEVTRRNFPMVSSLNTTAVNPTTRTWNGCGTGTGTLPTAAQCAAINALLPRFYGVIPRQLNQELYFGKLDYRLNDRNTLSASFNFLHSLSPNGIQTAASSTSGSALTSNGDDAVTVRNGRLQWTMVPNSAFVNEFHFGIATDRQADTFDNAELGQGLGYLQVSVNGTQLGPANYLPRIEPSERRLQFQDNATWTKGKHTIKFGADIASTYDYVYFISNFYGSYTYQTVNAFALDFSGGGSGKNWQSYAQTLGTGPVDYTIKDLGFYLQDSWRATDRLTLNIGARYEYAVLPQPKICNHDYTETCHLDSSPLNLAPRLGLAYRLNDKTVLQAGFGIFHSRFQGGTIDNLFTTGNGIYQSSISLAATQAPQLAAGPTFPNALPAVPAAATASTINLQYLAPGFKTPYSEQGNIGIQRELTHDLALDVQYLWSRGIQIMGIRDMNLPVLGNQSFTYIINDLNGNPVSSYTTPVYTGTRPDKRYAGVYRDENGVVSFYNGLAVHATKRFSHGLQAQVSYTWSHEIDDGQSNAQSTNNLFGSNANYWTINGNYRANMSSGALDQRHRAAISWIWAPTFTKRTGAFYRYVVNNWQLSSITTLASGRPFTVSLKDNDSTSALPVPGMFSNFNLSGSGLTNVVPFLPYYSQYFPPKYNTDARLSKVLPFGESGHKQLYLNWEVFNISNSWTPTSISSFQAYTELKGIITPTPLGAGSADGGFPDGTQARRMQISARFIF